jgi:hypothetical protein
MNCESTKSINGNDSAVTMNQSKLATFAVRTTARKLMRLLAVGWVRIGFACSVIAAVGCTDKKPQPTYPASGVVVWSDGQSAKELALSTVTLTAKGSEGPTIPVNPRGQVQADGTFVLQTYEPGDGAPSGKYHAAVTYSYPSRLRDSPSQSLPFDPRFQNYKTSGLEITIKPEQNQLKLTIQRAQH